MADSDTTPRRDTISAGSYEYTVVFEPAEEGGYVVTVPALPGCVTEGDTFEEAQMMAEEAIQGFLEALQKAGEEIPVEYGEPITRRIAVRLSPA